MESEAASLATHEVLVCRSVPQSLTEALDFAAEVNVILLWPQTKEWLEHWIVRVPENVQVNAG